MRFPRALIGAFLVAVSSTVQASPITFSFSNTLTDIPADVQGGKVCAGTLFSGQWFYSGATGLSDADRYLGTGLT